LKKIKTKIEENRALEKSVQKFEKKFGRKFEQIETKNLGMKLPNSTQ
jgi:hypothetical protein